MSNSHQRYEFGEELGEGTYGIVYEGVDKETKRVVAIKKMKFISQGERFSYAPLREVRILKELKHKNIVQLIDVLHQKNKYLNLVFEYMHTDLQKLMDEQSEDFSLEMVYSIMYQLCIGICYCHSQNIIHCDLKPDNLLIDNQGNLKIADFGMARRINSFRKVTEELVMLWYRAPELLLGISNYDVAIDVWAIGCIFAELVLHDGLFEGDNERDQLDRIFQLLGTPTLMNWPAFFNLLEHPDDKKPFKHWNAQNMTKKLRKLSKDGVDLLKETFTYDPSCRINVLGMLQHPYFARDTRIPEPK